MTCLGMSKIALMQITNWLLCVLFSLSEGACIWLRCGAPQVQVSARNEQQISPWSQQSWGNALIISLCVNVWHLWMERGFSFSIHAVTSCHARANSLKYVCDVSSWSQHSLSCMLTSSCMSTTLSGWTRFQRNTTTLHCPSWLRSSGKWNLLSTCCTVR